jgi:hypothetical protein
VAEERLWRGSSSVWLGIGKVVGGSEEEGRLGWLADEGGRGCGSSPRRRGRDAGRAGS